MQHWWIRSWVVFLIIDGCVAGLVSPAVAQDEDVENLFELPGYVAGFSQLAWSSDARAAEEVAGPEFMYAIVIEFEDAESAKGGFELMSGTDERTTSVDPREELGDDVAAAVAQDDEAGVTAHTLTVLEHDVLFYVVVSGEDEVSEQVVYDVMELMLSREPSEEPAEVSKAAEVTGSWAAVFPTEADADILMGLEPYPVFDLRTLSENQAATPAA